MKKTIITLIAASLTIAVKAQDNKTDFRSQFTAGCKVGGNYSNVYDSYGESFHSDPKVGFATGVFMTLPIGKFFGIQPELLFSQKGFKATGRILDDSYSFSRTTNYIDIPLLFAFKPSEFLTLLAGPQYSYLISQRDVFVNATTSIAQEQEFQNDNIRKNTLCLVSGVDLNLKHVVIGARVGIDVQNNNGNMSSTTPRYKNLWLQATVGYRLYRKS